MTAILDTSFLFALTDLGDRNHDRVLAVAQSSNEDLEVNYEFLVHDIKLREFHFLL